VVEDGTEVGEVGLLAEHVEEGGQVPVVGDLVSGADVEQAAQGGVAVQLGRGAVEVGVAQGDGQEGDAPQPLDGEVVAAAGGAEALGELLVGAGVAEVLDGLEAGEVLRLAPGEEGLGGVDRLRGAAPSREVLGRGGGVQRNGSPGEGGCGAVPVIAAGAGLSG
jgi:hypothetical protein